MPPDPMVHVIDDDDAVRESLEFLLRAAQMQVRTYDSATAFLEGLAAAEAGCIVTDVRMPDISGIDLLRRLKDLDVRMPVIVITGHGDVPLAVEAMKVGALDFFEKPFEDEALIEAVRSALNRQEIEGKREIGLAEIRTKLDMLSGREREVLQGLVAGQPNKIIAFDLGISPRTVEIYRANVMTKMNASSLSDLVRMAIVAGILDASSGPKASKPS
jgi:two-component system, LuxR family, response regulator FixJ